ncbi:hypothetical protein [Curtobacterium sp. SAFR-003]|uniref:hypothetical protein n=1 Tax=Curtobacterium sp. SAFR-003 TaxID=3387276 RepID=UPI003F81BD53
MSTLGGSRSLAEEREADWRKMLALRVAITIVFAAAAIVPHVIYAIHANTPADSSLLERDSGDISAGVGLAAAAIPVFWLTRSTYDLAGGMAAVASTVAGLGADKTWASIAAGTRFAFEPMSTAQRIVLVTGLGILSLILIFTGKVVDRRRNTKARDLEATSATGFWLQVRRDRENGAFEESALRQNIVLHNLVPSFLVVFSVSVLIVFVSV